MNVNQVLLVLEEIGKECRASEMKIHRAQVHETTVSEADILLSSQRIYLMADLLTRIYFNNKNFRVPELSDFISKGFGEVDARRIIMLLEAEAKKSA